MVLLATSDAAEMIGITRNGLIYHSLAGHIRCIRSSTGDRLFTPRSIAKFQAWRKKQKGRPAAAIARERVKVER